MISQSSAELRHRAERVRGWLDGVQSSVIEGSSLIGGGSTPERPLAGWLIAVECDDVVQAEERCRKSNPPVIARIEDGKLLFDLRTIFPWEEEELVRIIRESCARS